MGMHILTEEEVYNGTKRLLKGEGYVLLGGQPPRGVNHLPVIEVKSGTNDDKGSKDAYKPDLIAFKQDCFLIIERKPVYCEKDINKLEEILDSEKRTNSLFEELKQRGCLFNVRYEGDKDTFRKHIKGAHAYSGEVVYRKGVCHIIVENFHGAGKIIDLSDSFDD